jgi:hypothetical protein
MTLTNLGPLLADLQGILQSKGCQVTEIALTVYPGEADTAGDRDDSAPRQDCVPHDSPCRGHVCP